MTSSTPLPDAIRLTRSAAGAQNPRLRDHRPARIVHLGLGAFHRAHQAWFTDAVDEHRAWGIAAFTGRSSGRDVVLTEQQGLYTLIERARQGDRATIVGSIVEAHRGNDLHSLISHLADPGVAIVTLTVTEAGYHMDPDGRPRASGTLDADIEALRTRGQTDGLSPLSTLPGRLLLGLQARQRINGAPIAIVPCDNLPENGATLRTALLLLAERIDSGLAAWIAQDVSFVSTVVDRITPATTPEDLETARELTGFDDRSPVVTEPYRDWILRGDFPLGRPRWEDAGARFVLDARPFERRKLTMLNGAHTLLACTGLVRGHTTVAEAIADPTIRPLVERFWDEAAAVLPAETNPNAYRTELLSRFANPRIQHRLAQIAADSTLKMRLRIVPVLYAERAAGRQGDAAIAAIAAWLRFEEQDDPRGDHRARLADLDERIAADTLLGDAIIMAAGGE